MREIGGYLELELPKGASFINNNGLLLANGRNALEAIFRSLMPIELIWLPLYTCEVVLEPIQKLGIKYKHYSIDDKFEINSIPDLKDNEFLLYTNYFGIKDSYVKFLEEKLNNKLIVDNAQALYYKPSNNASFAYSPRKFVGIPDGGIAFCVNPFSIEVKDRDHSYDRCSHLLKRIDISAQEGYNDFRNVAESLKGLPVRAMSNLTYRLLCSIDFERVKDIRRRNFELLHEHLCEENKLSLPDIMSFACPMVYPFWPSRKGIKDFLISNKIFVATYWPNVKKWCNENSLEFKLSDEVAFIPIDQRYEDQDINYILNIINKWK